ncbi:proline-rich transmembrane protein 1 isoform X1 [Lemur catta]|uniref:proline-rich transmembrane protein 1 isoform X1 n=1 Tax=Lemur catta TaxID=9447 RepID=UPI001E2681DF|nr:proline-rich transmembrane protein 1 isoform X1 [Lemur catta]XP_045397710.1 proline-rich transmembrane protein 1 isoform X1 [Lemur catta]
MPGCLHLSISALLPSAPSGTQTPEPAGPPSPPTPAAGTLSQRDRRHVIRKVRTPRLSPSHFSTTLQCPSAPGRTPSPTPTGSPFLAPSPPPPLPPVWHCHPPALRGRWPGLFRSHRSAWSLILRHAAAAPPPRPARPCRWGAPTRLRYLAPHATRPLPAGDSLRGPTSPAAASRRRPAPAGAGPDCTDPRLRGAHAHGGGGHAAAGGLRSARIPPAAAALHCLRAGLPGGHALCRRNSGGDGSDLDSPAAATGPRAGPTGAEAPTARLHADRGADHHLLLLAYGHHRHLQGSAGAHGLGPRRHGVGRDSFPRGPELLLHLPGRGHRGHGALYHPHRSHHHRRAAPRELLGSLKTPPARPHPPPLDLPGAFCSLTADPVGALHTGLWGRRTSPLLKLRLQGTSHLSSKLRIQFLRNPSKAHTPRDAAFWDPGQTLGPQLLQAPTPSKYSETSRAPSLWSSKTRRLYRLRPNPDKPRLQVGRLRLLLVSAG